MKLHIFLILLISFGFAQFIVDIPHDKADTNCSDESGDNIRAIYNNSGEYIYYPFQSYELGPIKRLLIITNSSSFHIYIGDLNCSVPEYNTHFENHEVVYVNGKKGLTNLNMTDSLDYYVSNFILRENYSLYQNGPVALVFMENISKISNGTVNGYQIYQIYPNRPDVIDFKVFWNITNRSDNAYRHMVFANIGNQEFEVENGIEVLGRTIYNSTLRMQFEIIENTTKAYFKNYYDRFDIEGVGKSGYIALRISILEITNILVETANVQLKGDLLEFNRKLLVADIKMNLIPNLDEGITKLPPLTVTYESQFGKKEKELQYSNNTKSYFFDDEVWFDGNSFLFPLDRYNSSIEIKGNFNLNKTNLTEIRENDLNPLFDSKFRFEESRVDFDIKRSIIFWAVYISMILVWVHALRKTKLDSIWGFLVGLLPFIPQLVLTNEFVLISIGNIIVAVIGFIIFVKKRNKK